MDWRRWFYLSRADRGVLLFLMGCVLAVFVVYKCLYPGGDAPADYTAADARLEDSLRRELEGRVGFRKAAGRDSSAARRTPETFPFNPNRADSATFVRLGLRPWQASNALKYRRRGGRWRSPDDFARLYGLSEADFRRLRPYIRINPEYVPHTPASDRSERRDTARRRYPTKFLPGTKVDLNRADTNTLRRIPGIGPYYSRAIRRYGERLGGYVSVAQLKEIEGLPADIGRWFVLDSVVEIRKIHINRATFKQLVRHPYLSYEQVKSLFDYRRKYGDISGWQQLRFCPGFSDRDVERLMPYVAFD